MKNIKITVPGIGEDNGHTTRSVNVRDDGRQKKTGGQSRRGF